jgi:enamine deaminase RidA (YjgF/YER057c/UK114 family)
MTKDEEKRKNLGVLPLRRVNNLIFLSGHGCEGEDGKPVITGHVGDNLSLEDGIKAARKCGENLLKTLENHLGSLDKIKSIVKVLGFVNSASTFYGQPAVMNGFSELMAEHLGERGKHARSAIGTSVLPNNQAVEIEMIVEIY